MAEEKKEEEKEELTEQERETLWQILQDWLQKGKIEAKKKMVEVE